ncbi:MAG: alcohol dehydrogenase catalytic domain-containing protein [Verrucomicrobiota bacterium]|nr:alcohol dehydrogenase catalytic domain-containing protein [Verrucomicrobiota bacterium]
MKALFYPAFETLEVTERPDPVAAADEVIIKVSACGLCGSELETFKNKSPRRTPPLIMGHEFCGVIEDAGALSGQFKQGQKVVANSLTPCGTCIRCKRGDTHLCAYRQIFGMHRMGAFAEYVNVPVRSLIPWPETLPAEAACLAEPLGNGVHICNIVKHLKPETVLVIGAGPIGIMAQQAVQALLHCKTFVADLSDERLSVATRVGAEKVFNSRSVDVPKAILEMTAGEGVDLVIDAVGSAITKKHSLACTRPGGATVWIGLYENTVSVDTYDITLPEKFVFGTYAATLEELGTALALMDAGKVEVASWVKTFSLNDSVKAFHRMLAAKEDDIKAVVRMPND